MNIVRNSNERLMLGCCIGALVGFLVLGAVFLNYRRNLKDYVEVDAILQGIAREHGQTEESALNLFSYKVYSYSYEGREYTGRRQIFLSLGNKAGQQERILINPKNPEKLEDTLMQKVLLLAMAGCILFLCLELPYTLAGILGSGRRS